MNGKPEISVVMPAFNEERYLREAIESVLHQTFARFELIVVDDCSTDGSGDIIGRYAARDDRIVAVRNQQNLGRSRSRNLALEAAKGRYIAILDADDIALPSRLEREYACLEGNPGIYLVGTGIYKIDRAGQVVGSYQPPTNPVAVRRIMGRRCCVMHPSAMFRNERRYRYRDKFGYSQDYDLFLRMLSDGKDIANLPELLVKYRLDDGGQGWIKHAKRIMYSEKAKEFYRQRALGGEDGYDAFDPQVIEAVGEGPIVGREALRAVMRAKFMLNDLEGGRRACREYFRKYGVMNGVLAYWLISYLGSGCIGRIRNMIRKYA